MPNPEWVFFFDGLINLLRKGCQLRLPSKSRVWFDCSTVRQLSNDLPVGLSRLEINALRGSLALPPEHVGFCAFDRYGNQMVEVSRDRIVTLVEQFGRSRHGALLNSCGPRKNKTYLKQVGRDLERFIRVASRASLSRARRLFTPEAAIPQWQPGDVFALTGSTWDRLNERMLNEIVFDHGLQLAVIVSDMIPAIYPHQFHSKELVLAFEKFVEFVAKHSSLTLGISQSTKNDFDRFARQRGITPRHSEVIYLGADPIPECPSTPNGLPDTLIQQPFVVSVSSIQVRKNYQLLYQLWRRFAEEGRTNIPRLVIVGSKGWLASDLTYQIERDPLVKDSIVILNHVDDEQLHWLYANCNFTLYPSLYEGWGLPIVEGMMHGKVCLASSTSSMPEASQGLAVHLDPLDFANWHQTIVRWCDKPEILAELSRGIRERYRPRTWGEFGTEFCERLCHLANGNVVSRAA
ncbi:glycosyltransferase family 1 protein [Bremerella cremea]|uniref:Glycosyl transferase family 1 domain-containing protein n=2 Tax=Pirellulales TaxID=2691354 RepID=A0A2S8FCD4_9BACT|nr:hypothetical protein C5Y83_27635 [Blastopirellula marina]RCS43120.1 glycosyltransferase family 1 protein [Bremerella cremea]